MHWLKIIFCSFCIVNLALIYILKKIMTSQVIYNGSLRTTCTHFESKTEVLTDAPKDNHGLGEKFSPTDLTATSLASCMLSIMGILVQNTLPHVNLTNSIAHVTKVMGTEPRRIAEIKINIIFPSHLNASDKDKEMLQRVALNCPVAHSLHPNIVQDITFSWG
jgi:uncharacterized OsmC-like protein